MDWNTGGLGSLVPIEQLYPLLFILSGTTQLVGIECALCQVTGVHVYEKCFPYKSVILDVSILCKANRPWAGIDFCYVPLHEFAE